MPRLQRRKAFSRGYFTLLTDHSPHRLGLRPVLYGCNGFCFGNLALFLDGDYLNNKNEGRCLVGKDKFYDIEENERGESPLTGLKDQFTCSFLEVYKILFD